MKKFLAIVKREYLQNVRSKAFVISTIIGPLLMLGFSVLPGLLFGLKTGGATQIAVVDQTGRMYESVRAAVMRPDEEDETRLPAQTPGSSPAGAAREAFSVQYEIEETPVRGRPLEEIKRELSARVRQKELDAYLILPPDILQGGKPEFYGRNLGDLITIGQLERRLNRAVREQRMKDSNIDAEQVRALTREVEMLRCKPGERCDAEASSEGNFFLAIGVASFIVIAILMYGQLILSAVVEEKTTRLAEVLFSSVRPFTLMAGKLIGISLVAMTQYGIWVILFVAFALYGAAAAAASGFNVSLPSVPPSMLIYALLYFIIGFFLYATIFALIGAMVTTEKEAGQITVPLSMLLAVAIYLAFPVIRGPNSAYAFWVSMIPFFSPVTMLVRIVTETPPFWQIALSLLIGVATIALMVWLTARVYRVGMLMYGKRASIPEVLRWVRQS
ncbi:MAG: ABC transporter permease [Acidobacteriota bacterium]|nr:ABC transporter permease [Acidobacteriota bacterium]